MSKPIRENCIDISIFKLNNWDVLNDGNSGKIIWTNQFTGTEMSIGYDITLFPSIPWQIELYYKHNDKHVEHSYSITTTPCYFGGERYWFVCFCGNRVAKLYLGYKSRLFACRGCYSLTYSSRVNQYSYTLQHLKEDMVKIKRTYYSGTITRKYRSYLKKKKVLEKSLNKL